MDNGDDLRTSTIHRTACEPFTALPCVARTRSNGDSVRRRNSAPDQMHIFKTPGLSAEQDSRRMRRGAARVKINAP